MMHVDSLLRYWHKDKEHSLKPLACLFTTHGHICTQSSWKYPRWMIPIDIPLMNRPKCPGWLEAVVKTPRKLIQLAINTAVVLVFITLAVFLSVLSHTTLQHVLGTFIMGFSQRVNDKRQHVRERTQRDNEYEKGGAALERGMSWGGS